jgi:hypothetical protein
MDIREKMWYHYGTYEEIQIEEAVEKAASSGDPGLL